MQNVVSIGQILGLEECDRFASGQFEKELKKAKRADRRIREDVNEEELLRRQNQLRTGGADMITGEHDYVSMEILQEIKKVFKGHIYRRTSKAKGPDGQAIWDSYDIREQSITLKLSEEEMEVIDAAAQAALKDTSIEWYKVSKFLNM